MIMLAVREHQTGLYRAVPGRAAATIGSRRRSIE